MLFHDMDNLNDECECAKQNENIELILQCFRHIVTLAALVLIGESMYLLTQSTHRASTSLDHMGMYTDLCQYIFMATL